jgi:membrane-associated phospholipid phosphatase
MKVQAQNADIRMLRSIQDHRNPAHDQAWNVWSQSAYPVAIVLPLGLFTAGMVSHRSDMAIKGAEIGTGIIAGMALTTVLKYTVQRPRPYEQYPDIVPYHREDSPSFPSGHTTAAFATATGLTLAYPRWYVAVPAYLWAAGVGYSRLQLGVHYPSDVLCGALIGTGTAVASHYVSKRLQKRFSKKQTQAPVTAF